MHAAQAHPSFRLRVLGCEDEGVAPASVMLERAAHHRRVLLLCRRRSTDILWRMSP